MKTKEIIKKARELAKPFRISKGKDFRLKDVDPDDTLDFTKEADKPRAKEALAMGVTALAELQDKLYAQDKWAVLLDLSSNGRGWQGRRHQARHVRRKSTGLPGVFVQIALGRGSGSRLSLALHEMPAESGPHRNL